MEKIRNISDHISESLVKIWVLKYLNSFQFSVADHGSGMEKSRSEIRNENSRSKIRNGKIQIRDKLPDLQH
jgi:hypothetical protein